MSSQPQSQDQPMADAPVNGEAEAQVTNDDIDIGEQRIRVVGSVPDTCRQCPNIDITLAPWRQ